MAQQAEEIQREYRCVKCSQSAVVSNNGGTDINSNLRVAKISSGNDLNHLEIIG